LVQRAVVSSSDGAKRRFHALALEHAEAALRSQGPSTTTLLVKMRVQSRLGAGVEAVNATADEILALFYYFGVSELSPEEFRKRYEDIITVLQYLDSVDTVDSEEKRILFLGELEKLDACLDMKIILAETYKRAKNWQQAIDLLESSLAKFPDRVRLRRCIQWQTVRCYYEIGAYDEAISAGGAAIEHGARHKGEVNKYMALSYKELGDTTEALRVAHRGVLYSLDNGDRAKVYEVYDELSGDNSSSINDSESDP